MCQFKHWFYDDNGYVVQCEECSYFQLSFGTTMLTLNNNNYKAFVDMVASKKQQHISMCDKQVKCVVLSTPCSSIHAILTENELDNLHNMLEEADTQMKTEQLLLLFK